MARHDHHGDQTQLAEPLAEGRLHAIARICDREVAGLLELKPTSVSLDDGSEKVVEQLLVTPRGLAKISELIERKAPWRKKTGTKPPLSFGQAGPSNGPLL